MIWTEMALTGLRAGLNQKRAGLNWSRLNCTRLHWIWPDWTELDMPSEFALTSLPVCLCRNFLLLIREGGADGRGSRLLDKVTHELPAPPAVISFLVRIFSLAHLLLLLFLHVLLLPPSLFITSFFSAEASRLHTKLPFYSSFSSSFYNIFCPFFSLFFVSHCQVATSHPPSVRLNSPFFSSQLFFSAVEYLIMSVLTRHQCSLQELRGVSDLKAFNVTSSCAAADGNFLKTWYKGEQSAEKVVFLPFLSNQDRFLRNTLQSGTKPLRKKKNQEREKQRL